jgi:hypothetical protein
MVGAAAGGLLLLVLIVLVCKSARLRASKSETLLPPKEPEPEPEPEPEEVSEEGAASESFSEDSLDLESRIGRTPSNSSGDESSIHTDSDESEVSLGSDD